MSARYPSSRNEVVERGAGSMLPIALGLLSGLFMAWVLL
jgi:hypothetical protein